MRLLPRFRRQKEGERAEKKGKKKKGEPTQPARDTPLQPGVTVIPHSPALVGADATEDAAPRAPAEEVYGCFVQFNPAIIPEEIHVPQWLVSAVRGVKNNIIDPLNPLTHNVAEVDHKLPYLECESTRPQQPRMRSRAL